MENANFIFQNIKFNTNSSIGYSYFIKNNEKNIYYYGIKHNNNPKDKCYFEIENNVKAIKPELIVVEGVYQLNEPRKDQFLNAIIKLKKEYIIQNYGENLFVAQLAHINNINVISPEPKLLTEINMLIDKEYDKEKIILYYMCKLIYQWFRIKSTITINDYIDKCIRFLNVQLKKIKYEFTYEEFIKIHKEILGIKINIKDEAFYRKLVDPVKRKENLEYQKFGLNRMAAISCAVRDVYFVDIIKKELKKVSSIFIVFGETHAYLHEEPLKGIFRSFQNNTE